jgi:CubicO group peptidase (beta-lactamase class C family)
MLKYAMIFLTSLIFSVAAAQLALEKNIDSLIATYTGAQAFSGVVLIAEKGTPVYEKAFGYSNYANGAKMKTSAIFELASVSKQFTAAIILKCMEKGLLTLDDKMEKYVQTPYPGITIRQLLNHTSGLPDYQELMDTYWDKNKIAGNEEIIAYLNQYHPPALFMPGQAYQYSNTGYVLLATIAEKASGKNFVTLCRQWIFKPFGMRDTDIRSRAEKITLHNYAIGHGYVKSAEQFIAADSFPSSNYTIWLGNRKGPGRVSSTAQDVLKWDRVLYTQKFLRNATKAAAFAPARLHNGNLSYYGFGWDILQHPVLGKIVSHNGDNPGYKTQFVRCIDADKTIIILSNNYAEKMEDLLQQILNWIKK